MGLLEIMTVILFGYLIGFKLSDFTNMVVLSMVTGCGVGVGFLVYFAGREFLLSPNGPYAFAAVIFISFVVWKLGAPPKEEKASLDRRPNVAGRKPGLQQA